MSYILKNAVYINLTTGDYYGIKPESWDEIQLPFTLSDWGEVETLETELKKLFPKVEVEYRTTLHASRKESSITIGRSEEGLIGIVYSGKEGLKMLDTVLRKTILGRKLKEYLQIKYNKSEKKAQEILEEITPLADA